jgi:Leucine-rich repeat (LRR) protein
MVFQQTLIITTEKTGTPVNLDEILRNASGYPLEELYIINFGSSVSGLPASVGDFSGLVKLCLTKNNLKQLPSSISNLNKLKVLSADMNPLNKLMPGIASLQNLEELGIADTPLSEPEISQIHQSLPHCKIQRQ